MPKTPFPVCHGIHAEVYEGIHFHALPGKLARRWAHVCEIVQVDARICRIAHYIAPIRLLANDAFSDDDVRIL